MLGLSFVCCVAVVAVFVWLHGLHGGWSALIYVPLAFLIGAVFPAAFFVAVLLGLVGWFVPGTARARTRWITGGIATSFVFGFVWWSTQDEINELRELRAKYPIVSLTDRLAYESASPRFAPPSVTGPGTQFSETTGASASEVSQRQPVQLALSAAVTVNLNQLEADMKWAGESYLFRQLHSSSYESFIRANGFGVTRMARVNRGWIEHELDDPDPIPQATPASEYQKAVESPADMDREELLAETTPIPDAVNARVGLNQLHRAGRDEFLDADRFGFIESRQRAAGFQPHAFRQAVQPHVPNLPQTLQVARLELVSLLKFDTPRVYVSDYLPDMEQLQDIPTRELDGFETAALAKLWTEQDIVVEEYSGEIRMLGSLRAGSHCLKCHNARRGDLLGAFSYRIRMPGQRPRKVLPKDRQTALYLKSRSHLHVAMTQADRY